SRRVATDVLELDDGSAHDPPPQREAERREDGTVRRTRNVRDEVDTIETAPGAIDLVTGLDDDRMLGQAGHASQRVRDWQRREIDHVDAARPRYRLPDQIVVDLFRLAGPADERNVTRIGQERQCGPYRAFHVEAGRQNRETWRRLQVTHAALVHPADDHGRTRPELITRVKNELKRLGKRRDDHVEALIPVLRAVDGPEPAPFDVGRGKASDVHVLHLDADPEGPLCEQAGADA